MIILSLGYYELKWVIGIFIGVLILAAWLFNKFTGGNIFRYSKNFKEKQDYHIVLIAHWLISIAIAIILPNNFLTDFEYFQRLFKKNEAMIPVSMLVVLFIALLILGIIITLVTKAIVSRKNKIIENESRSPKKYR